MGPGSARSGGSPGRLLDFPDRKDPISAMLLFFVAVFLVIIGTFCLFTAGSIAVLKRLRANRAFIISPSTLRLYPVCFTV